MDEVNEFSIEEGLHQAVILKFSYGKPDLHELRKVLPKHRIPVVFAKRHCKNMLNPMFLDAPHGKAWEVEVEKSQGQILLAKGWNDFSAYYSISVSNLLMLTYIPRFHFDVAIYDQSTTKIEYLIHQYIEADEEEKVIPVIKDNANVIEDIFLLSFKLMLM
ncbi:putative B3 domain-containing protein Os08g0325100 [Solanum pennellii]|uniref:B3 domain-containing protein Os08g0325100 n=1 Tax=Solanum pennellii TaxID=28526 RepID=A0ABM1UZF5_SOLPN|nr:putative B3 domain-containing protein Os08g0325100 [Solanum pennellii]